MKINHLIYKKYKTGNELMDCFRRHQSYGGQVSDARNDGKNPLCPLCPLW